jgi:hypothetical protein
MTYHTQICPSPPKKNIFINSYGGGGGVRNVKRNDIAAIGPAVRFMSMLSLSLFFLPLGPLGRFQRSSGSLRTDTDPGGSSLPPSSSSGPRVGAVGEGDPLRMRGRDMPQNDASRDRAWGIIRMGRVLMMQWAHNI